MLVSMDQYSRMAKLGGTYKRRSIITRYSQEMREVEALTT
jgi:hypothetical protein